MNSTSPNGMTAKVTSAGNTAMQGASVCSSRSAPRGMMSSLVRNLSGSAISVLTRPAPAKPKIAARLAPMRSWISALPLRSTQPSSPASCRALRVTASARIAEMPY
jgi:hypothetical protein